MFLISINELCFNLVVAVAIVIELMRCTDTVAGIKLEICHILQNLSHYQPVIREFGFCHIILQFTNFFRKSIVYIMQYNARVMPLRTTDI